MSIAALSRDHVHLLEAYPDQVPEQFQCPIFMQPMTNPFTHVGGCGQTFDLSAVQEALRSGSKCPIDRAQVTMADFKPNYDLRNAIREFCDNNLKNAKKRDEELAAKDVEIAALRAQLEGVAVETPAPSAPPLSEEDLEECYIPAPSAPPLPKEDSEVHPMPASSSLALNRTGPLDLGEREAALKRILMGDAPEGSMSPEELKQRHVFLLRQIEQALKGKRGADLNCITKGSARELAAFYLKEHQKENKHKVGIGSYVFFIGIQGKISNLARELQFSKIMKSP